MIIGAYRALDRPSSMSGTKVVAPKKILPQNKKIAENSCLSHWQLARIAITRR